MLLGLWLGLGAHGSPLTAVAHAEVPATTVPAKAVDTPPSAALAAKPESALLPRAAEALALPPSAPGTAVLPFDNNVIHNKSAEPDWRINVELANETPLAVAAGIGVGLPYGLHVGASVGFVPEPYVDLINEASTRLDFYDDPTAALIEQTLDDTLIWTARAAINPWRGLDISAAYSQLLLSGSASTQEVLDAFSEPVPSGLDAATPYDVESTLHILRADFGWTFRVAGGLYLRPSVGVAVTTAADTAVDAGITGNVLNDRARELIADEAEVFLDDIYTDYAHTVVLSIAAGYSLGL